MMRDYGRSALLTCLCFYVGCHMPQFSGMMNARYAYATIQLGCFKHPQLNVAHQMSNVL